MLEEEATLADNLAPTGDADTDKRYKKRYALLFFFVSCYNSRSNGLLAAQVGRTDREDEEEPGTTATSQECKDCKGRGYPNAAQSAPETGYDGNNSPFLHRAVCLSLLFTAALWPLRSNGAHEYVTSPYHPFFFFLSSNAILQKRTASALAGQSSTAARHLFPRRRLAQVRHLRPRVDRVSAVSTNRRRMRLLVLMPLFRLLLRRVPQCRPWKTWSLP